MPSILNDGNRFFPNVLKDGDFQRKGVLTATEGRVSWGVVDPRRHRMTIWQKDRDDFVEAAQARNASLISNAPFYLYSGGAKWWATACYLVDAFFTGIGLAYATEQEVARERRRLYKTYFTGQTVEGYIFGNSEGIVFDTDSRPQAAFFGRAQGRAFADYQVNQGDAPRIAEVIGGLFRSVNNYAAIDNGTASQVGTWGLAPILAAPQDKLQILRECGLTDALSEYESSASQQGEEITPFGEGAENQVNGLIIALFGQGSPMTFAQLLAGVLVKEAVRVDGNSSILLATGQTVLQGEFMNGVKRTYNNHGYMFMPG